MATVRLIDLEDTVKIETENGEECHACSNNEHIYHDETTDLLWCEDCAASETFDTDDFGSDSMSLKERNS